MLSHSIIKVSDRKSCTAYLRVIIAACKELKIKSERTITPAQSQLNHVVRNRTIFPTTFLVLAQVLLNITA